VPAIDFGDVADDGEAETRSRLSGRVQPCAPREEFAAPLLRDAGPIVLDKDVDILVPWLDRHEHSPAAIFGGILNKIAEHLVEVLPLDTHLRLVVARNIDGDALVEPVDGPLDGLEALPDASARLRGSAPSNRARPRQVMVDLAAHNQRFPADGVGKVRRPCGCRIGDDGKGGLQRMGKVSCVPAGFLGLLFAMGEKLVDLLGQWLDLAWKFAAHPRLLARANIGDLVAHAPERPEAIESLKGGKDEKTDAERAEAPHQRRAKPEDLIVDRLPGLGDLEAPLDRRAWQDGIALGDAQRL